jgi:hypothetical protein
LIKVLLRFGRHIGNQLF